MKKTVLLGFAEAISAPEVVWSLIDQGYSAVAFARKGRRAALRHSRHVKVYEVTPPEKDLLATQAELSALLKLLKSGSETGKIVFLPLDDAAVWLAAGMTFEPDCFLAGPLGENAKLALDKNVQLEAARRAGFNVLPTRVAKSADEVMSQRDFPIIIKSALAVGENDGRLEKGKYWICESRGEMENAVEQWREKKPVLIQPYVSGVGEGIFGLAVGKEVQSWSAHRRLRMMNPHGSGSSAAVSQPVPSELKEPAENFIRQTNWSGIFMIELLRDASGKAWFMEFNGRSWGSMALSRRQGLEYPAWNANLAVDPDFRGVENNARSARVVCRNLGRELMHLIYVLRGPKSKAIHKWPSMWAALRDVAFIKRSDAFYNWRRNDPKVFWLDCYYTLCNELLKSRK